MTVVDWPSRIWARVAGAIVACATVGFLISSTKAETLASVDAPTARVTAAMLGWLGIAVHREAATLIHANGFAYEIVFSCTGLIPSGILVASIFVAGAPLASKLWGGFVGILSVLTLNLIR